MRSTRRIGTRHFDSELHCEYRRESAEKGAKLLWTSGSPLGKALCQRSIRMREPAIEEYQCLPTAWLCLKEGQEVDRNDRISITDGWV
jgi:hypothetical protein